MVGAALSMLGSVASSAANIYANRQAYEQQKALNRQKYVDMIDFAKQYGATPTSILSGITGSAGGAVPTASSSNNPVSDFGSTLSNAVTARASYNQSIAANDEARAALTNAETDRQLALMRLKFEPKKYAADIQKSLAEAFEASKNAFLHGSMSYYYKELTKDVIKVRPWKIAGLRQSLLNDMATFAKIRQDTKTSKAQEKYYKAGAEELDTRSDVNRMDYQLRGNEALNEGLRGFQIQWENNLLSYGIDPKKSFWENTGRLMYTNPDLFSKRMDMFITALNNIDGRLQDNLGEHYKRNAILGYGLYKLNDIHQKNANSRAYRFGTYTNAISSFIPFTGGHSPNPIGYKRY